MGNHIPMFGGGHKQMYLQTMFSVHSTSKVMKKI